MPCLRQARQPRPGRVFTVRCDDRCQKRASRGHGFCGTDTTSHCGSASSSILEMASAAVRVLRRHHKPRRWTMRTIDCRMPSAARDGGIQHGRVDRGSKSRSAYSLSLAISTVKMTSAGLVLPSALRRCARPGRIDHICGDASLSSKGIKKWLKQELLTMEYC